MTRGELTKLVPPLVFLLSAAVFLYLIWHESHGFWDLVRKAWEDEWKGQARIAKCNRSGTIMLLSVTVLVFTISLAHAFLRPESLPTTIVLALVTIILFAISAWFLTNSLRALADLERSKLFMGGKRADRPNPEHGS